MPRADDLVDSGVAAGPWVPVASSFGAFWGLDVPLSVLRDAGIPVTLDQRPFSEYVQMPLGSWRAPQVLVPPERADEAREILSSAGQRTLPVADEGPPEETFWTWAKTAWGFFMLVMFLLWWLLDWR